nr:TraG/TraD/VirD4 family protein [uncultured Agathobaculum sp.]
MQPKKAISTARLPPTTSCSKRSRPALPGFTTGQKRKQKSLPNFDKLIVTSRSREISASIILQSQSQLKTIYKDAADTIVGNCDTTLFLGGKEKSTLKEISELLGKETIDSVGQSENRGSQVSHGLNYQKLGKDMP